MARLTLGAALLYFGTSCSFDAVDPAPFTALPYARGTCPSTDEVFHDLFVAIRNGKFEPLKTVIERRLVAGPDGVLPSPSLRSLLGALVSILKGIGVQEATSLIKVDTSTQGDSALAPVALATLHFLAGDANKVPRYDATEAIATMATRCSAVPFLQAVSSLLRLTGDGSGAPERFTSLFGAAVTDLVSDPRLSPFLSDFERESVRGKPAVLGLADQVLVLLANDSFDVESVRTLFKSAVYPLVDGDMRTKIDRIIDLVGYAGRREFGIQPNLATSLRCLLSHDSERSEILGFAFDLLTDPTIDIRKAFDAMRGTTRPADDSAWLDVSANVIDILIQEPLTRQAIVDVITVMLTRPDVEVIVPFLIELIEEDLLSDLIDAAGLLLHGCGREA